MEASAFGYLLFFFFYTNYKRKMGTHFVRVDEAKGFHHCNTEPKILKELNIL